MTRYTPARAAGVVLFAAVLFSSAAPRASEPTAPPSRERMWAAVERLWSGTPDERLAVASGASRIFEGIGSLEPSDRNALIRVLSGVLEADEDDWLLDRLSRQLAQVDSPATVEFFLVALGHASPNVRWRAVDYFASREEPRAIERLERLWRLERRPWVRIDLVSALARQARHDLLMSALASGREAPAVVWQLVDSVAEDDPPGGAQLLAGALSRLESRARSRAMQGLGSNASPASLQVLLEASGRADLRFRVDALASLGLVDHEAARARLLEILESTGERRLVRAAAYGALYSQRQASEVDLPELPFELEGRLEEFVFLRAVSWRYLFDQAFRSNSIPGCEEGAADTRPASCAFWAAGRPVTQYEVVSGSDARTARCWKAPRVSGEPSDYPRIQVGQRFEAQDRFLADQEDWMEMDVEDCWLSDSEVRSLDEEAEVTSTVETPQYVAELDAPAEEVDDRYADRLRERGMIETFEPHEGVRGVRIRVDPTVPEQARTLIDAEDGSPGQIREGGRKLLRRLIRHRKVCPGIRREARITLSEIRRMDREGLPASVAVFDGSGRLGSCP